MEHEWIAHAGVDRSRDIESRRNGKASTDHWPGDRRIHLCRWCSCRRFCQCSRKKINENWNYSATAKCLYSVQILHFLQNLSYIQKNTVNKDLALFGWSRNPGADLFISRTEKRTGNPYFCRYKEETDFDFIIPFTDEASIHNAVTCCCVMLRCLVLPLMPLPRIYTNCGLLKCGLNWKKASITVLWSMTVTGCRSEFAQHSAWLLSQQQQHANRTVILRAISLQSGYEPGTLYKHIAGILSHRKLFRFIGIGPEISAHGEAFAAISNSTFESTGSIPETNIICTCVMKPSC